MTEVIEGAVAGIEGIRQINSQSQNDRSSVSIEFEVSRNPEGATSDVRDAVSRVIGRLPDGADTPVIRKVDATRRPSCGSASPRTASTLSNSATS